MAYMFNLYEEGGFAEELLFPFIVIPLFEGATCVFWARNVNVVEENGEHLMRGADRATDRSIIMYRL